MMTTKLTSIILACGVATFAVAAESPDKQAEEWLAAFKKADLNGSGGLSKAELDKTDASAFRSIKKNFDAMDANKDGQVTPRECADLTQKRRDTWLAAFKKADLNASGGLSKAELDKTTRFKRMKQNFDAMDSNHDGQITVAESDAYRPAPAAGASPAGEDWLAAFKKADLNDSGGLSKTEVGQSTAQSLAGLKQNFDQIDANKDGHVTAEEYQASLDDEGDNDEASLLSIVGKLFK